jgi:hypothetical protein
MHGNGHEALHGLELDDDEWSAAVREKGDARLGAIQLDRDGGIYRIRVGNLQLLIFLVREKGKGWSGRRIK